MAGGENDSVTLEREQLETILANVPVGVIYAERESHRILWINREAGRLLQSPAAAGADAAALYLGRRRDGSAYAPGEWPLARALATGEPTRDEVVELELDDGTRRRVAVTTAPVEERGSVIGAVAILTDVTDHEQRERATREFVANAAHELQTPIAAITAAVEVLEGGAKNDPAQRDRFLRHIDGAVARLARLTHALLVLARAQAAQEAPKAEVVELEPLARAVAGDHPESAVVVESEPGLAVVANPMLLAQVLSNLVDNAIRHAGTDVVVRCRRDGTRSRVDVVDRGSGIPPSEQPHVFERFQRSGEGDGFGLGLAIVHEAVAALGGELELDSGASGTRVSILLPGARLRRR